MTTSPRPSIVLVGAPGAGKTTVGRLLAQRWGLGFRDTDLDVEALAGKDVASIFVSDGEPVFRAWEASAVVRALAEHDGVLSLGGGAVLDPVTRAALRGHRVVLLDVGLGAAVSRVGLGAGRPVLAMSPRATLKVLLDERRPHYLEVATVVVPTDEKAPDEVADDVEAALAALAATP